MEFFKVIPSLYDGTTNLSLEQIQYAYKNSVLPSHVLYTDATKQYSINPAPLLAKERETLDYMNRLHEFINTSKHVLSFYRKVDKVPLLATSNTLISTFDIEIAVDANSIDELFSVCRTTNYIPVIWYRQYAKMQRNAPDMSFVFESKKYYKDDYDESHIMFYVYTRKDFKIPIEFNQAIARKSQFKNFMKIYNRGGKIYLYIPNMSDFLVGVYRDIVSDMFYKSIPLGADGTKTELQAIRHYTSHVPLNIYTIKKYITTTFELNGYIQPSDKSIKKIKPNNVKNFKYKLYMHHYKKDHKPISLYIYDTMVDAKRTLAIQCSYKSISIINWVFNFINKLLQLIPNEKPTNTLTIEPVENRYAAEPWTDSIYGYSRTCQVAKQPAVTNITNITDDTANAIRKSYLINQGEKQLMYFKTTDGLEYMVDCGIKKVPTLIPVRGKYKNIQYPVVPCCNNKTKINEDILPKYKVYMDYLNGVTNYDALYRVYSESTAEEKVALKKPLTTMYLCARGQQGTLGVRDKRSTSMIPFNYVYTILKDILNTSIIGRIGVVNGTLEQKQRSLIYAVHYAINQNYDVPVNNVISYMERYIYLCIQELCDISVSDAIEQIKHGHISPIFYRALQRYYKCHIHILTYNHDECPGGRIWHPVTPGFTYDFIMPKYPTVFILENYGTEFSQDDYPIYEPIYIKHSEQQKPVFVHDSDVTQTINAIKEQLYNYTTDIPYPVPGDYSVVAMNCDNFNKVRNFIIYNKQTKGLVSIYCDPLPSCVLAEYTFRGMETFNNTEKDIKDYVQYFMNTSARIEHHVGGYTIHAENLTLYCPIHTDAKYNHPFFSNGHTNFDLYSIGRLIADSTKDNILCLFSRYATGHNYIATQKMIHSFINSNELNRSKDIKQLINNATSSRISNLVPTDLDREYRYYLLYYNRINAFKEYRIKPHYYNNIYKYTNRYDIILPIASLADISMFRHMDIRDSIEPTKTPFLIKLNIPNIGTSIVLLKLLLVSSTTEYEEAKREAYRYRANYPNKHVINYTHDSGTNVYSMSVEEPSTDDSIEVYIYTYIVKSRYYYYLML